MIKGTDYVLANYRDPNQRYSRVEISNLTGPGGIFKIDLDWQSNNGERKYTEKSDFITIGTAEDGSRQIIEFDMGKAHLDEMKNGDKLYFASVGSGAQPSLPMSKVKSIVPMNSIASVFTRKVNKMELISLPIGS